jgi:hypothetical protein
MIPVTNNTGRPFSFQHAGIFYVLPTGVSAWPYEIAERLERKFGFQMGGAVPEPVVEIVPVVEPEVVPVAEEVTVPTPEESAVEKEPEPEGPAVAIEPEEAKEPNE